MDFDLKRMPIEESVKDGDLEFVDTLDTMELIWRGHKDKTKTDKYFTANFKDVLEFSKEDVKKNTIKLSYPTFQTKPIKDLDEFESIRAYWAEYRKKCEISEVLIDDDGTPLDSHNLKISKLEWDKIKNKVKNPLNELTKNNDKEVFLAKEKSGHSKDVFYYNDYKSIFEDHLNNEGLMNTSENILNFLLFYKQQLANERSGSNRYVKRIGNKMDSNNVLVRALWLSKKLGWWGLGKKECKISDVQFGVDVCMKFYTFKDIRNKFSIKDTTPDTDLSDSIRKKVGNQMDNYAHKLKHNSEEQNVWRNQTFIKNKRIERTLKEIKIELTPTLQIEPFIGDRHFGESVQLDEVALQRSQSIETKAMKAALRGKRVSDKEREALINAEGLDSIATISEQSKAEAKEAELEGGNKDAEK
jgi:hypothetical protein